MMERPMIRRQALENFLREMLKGVEDTMRMVEGQENLKGVWDLQAERAGVIKRIVERFDLEVDVPEWMLPDWMRKEP